MKVFSMHDVAGIKRVSPHTVVIYRYFTNDYHDTLENPDPYRGAEKWIDKFRDSLYEICNQMASEFPDLAEPYFYVESLNEVYPSLNAPLVTRAANFDIAFIDVLAETGLPVKPAVFTAAVGNPHESEYELLVPLARRCEEAGGMMGYHCFSADTDILTQSGWMNIKDFVENNKSTSVATLNKDTGKVEYQLPTDYYHYHYRGSMIHLFGKVDTLTTPNHRMWIRDTCKERKFPNDHLRGFGFVEAGNLPDNFEVKRDFGEYIGVNAEFFTIPHYRNRINQYEHYHTRSERKVPMDAWLEFFGFWITEGSVSQSGNVSISQNPGPVSHSIGKALEAIGYEPKYYKYDGKSSGTWVVHDVQLAHYLRQFGYSKEKYLPREIMSLSRRQLRILFKAMMLGDGHKDETYFTSSRRLADDFQELALKLGYITTLSESREENYVISLGKKRKTPRTSKQYISNDRYAGEVYCVTVPNGLVFVRRNGKPSWQGNSYWLANQDYGEPDHLWPYLAGRWVEMDKVFVSHGIHVRWYGGEGGAVGGRSSDGEASLARAGMQSWQTAAVCPVDATARAGFRASDEPYLIHIGSSSFGVQANGDWVSLLATAGWKDPECYNGDWPRYLTDIMRADELIVEWNQGHDDRYLGMVLFTTGIGTGWSSWQIREPETQSIMNALLERYS